MNYQKFSDLQPDAAEKRRTWVSNVRGHFANEHQRWGESLFKTLIVADTGGVVVVTTLLAQNSTATKSTCLRLGLTLFVLGAIGALNAIRHEFAGITERLVAWDRNSKRYLDNEITFGELYGPEKYMAQVDWKDHLVIWLPAAAFVLGCAFSVAYLWLAP